MTSLMLSSDAARILDVTPATVVSYARRGLLPAQKTVGGINIFRAEDVLALAARLRQQRQGLRRDGSRRLGSRRSV